MSPKQKLMNRGSKSQQKHAAKIRNKLCKYLQLLKLHIAKLEEKDLDFNEIGSVDDKLVQLQDRALETQRRLAMLTDELCPYTDVQSGKFYYKGSGFSRDLDAKLAKAVNEKRKAGRHIVSCLSLQLVKDFLKDDQAWKDLNTEAAEVLAIKICTDVNKQVKKWRQEEEKRDFLDFALIAMEREKAKNQVGPPDSHADQPDIASSNFQTGAEDIPITNGDSGEIVLSDTDDTNIEGTEDDAETEVEVLSAMKTTDPAEGDPNLQKKLDDMNKYPVTGSEEFFEKLMAISVDEVAAEEDDGKSFSGDDSDREFDDDEVVTDASVENGEKPDKTSDIAIPAEIDQTSLETSSSGATSQDIKIDPKSEQVDNATAACSSNISELDDAAPLSDSDSVVELMEFDLDKPSVGGEEELDDNFDDEFANNSETGSIEVVDLASDNELEPEDVDDQAVQEVFSVEEEDEIGAQSSIQVPATKIPAEEINQNGSNDSIVEVENDQDLPTSIVTEPPNIASPDDRSPPSQQNSPVIIPLPETPDALSCTASSMIGTPSIMVDLVTPKSVDLVTPGSIPLQTTESQNGHGSGEMPDLPDQNSRKRPKPFYFKDDDIGDGDGLDPKIAADSSQDDTSVGTVSLSAPDPKKSKTNIIGDVAVEKEARKEEVEPPETE